MTVTVLTMCHRCRQFAGVLSQFVVYPMPLCGGFQRSDLFHKTKRHDSTYLATTATNLQVPPLRNAASGSRQ